MEMADRVAGDGWRELEYEYISVWATHPTTYAEQLEDFLSVARPGVSQDPDALLVGNANTAPACRPCAGRTPASQFCPDREHPEQPCMCCGGLSAVEEQSNMAFWAMWSAPLEIAADLRNISAASAAILRNPEVIGVGQDALVAQGRRLWKRHNGVQLWHKRLASGGKAVLLYNGQTSPLSNATVELREVGFADCDRVVVRDLIARRPLGTHTGRLTLPGPIPPSGVALLNMTVLWPGAA